MGIASLGGCGVDRNRYVVENEALLERIPTFPEASPERVASRPYKRWHDAVWEPVAPVRGFTTHRSSELPAGVRPRRAIEFYRRELRDDWQLVGASRRSLSLVRGDAYVHVLAGPDRLTLWVDHDYCKDLWLRRGC